MPNTAAPGPRRYASAGGSGEGGTAGRPARGEPPAPAQEDLAEPRVSIFSIAALTPPSVVVMRRMTMTSAGIAQKSPHTHRIAAPICWSANGGKVTPGTWL